MNKIRKFDVFNKPSIKVPFFSPMITREDKVAAMGALESILLTDGPKLREFESAFSKFTAAKYAIGVSNATAALHLSLKALDIGKGDEVIIPNMTFVATASSVLHSGAMPVFADIEEDMNISVDSIKANLTSKTKAIIPVHFAGRSCSMSEIMKVARANDLFVIEDCAHAIGARYNNKHVGNFGDVGCFSFYPTKNITTIEGGMIITNSKKIAKYVTSARNHGITKSLMSRYSHGKPWNYDISEPGYNFRLDEIRSAIGLSQLKRVKKLNLMRKRAFEYYTEKLKEVKGVITPQISKQNENAYHLYIIRIQKQYGMSRDNLFEKLLHDGISSSVHYKPLNKFTVFSKLKNHKDLTNSKDLYEEIISLPFYPHITKKEQDLVIKSLKKNQNG